MKTNTELIRLESIITNEKTEIRLGDNNGSDTKKAIRYANHKRKEKTHVLLLDPVSNRLTWKNNKKREWTYDFESADHANLWWKSLISDRATN